jgi:hypothetical protein
MRHGGHRIEDPLREYCAQMGKLTGFGLSSGPKVGPESARVLARNLAQCESRRTEATGWRIAQPYGESRFRAFVEANDPNSLWPAVSRERLAEVDPTMFQIVSGLFADIEKRFGDRPGEQLRMDFGAAGATLSIGATGLPNSAESEAPSFS